MKKFTLFLVLLVSSMLVNAQWTGNTDINTEASTYESDSQDLKSIALNEGRTAIVFWKEVSTGGNYELWLQIIDSDGNKELGAEGGLISNTIPMSTFTNFWSLATDKDYNIYVGVTGSSDVSAWAFKLDNQGNNLWTSNGLNVGSGYLVTFLPLGSGNTIVSWMDNSTYQALMQKYDAGGNPIWAENKPVASSGYTTPANIFELSNGDFMSVYHSLTGSAVNSILHAQRYTTDGDMVWSEASQISVNITAYNYVYSATQIGDTIYYGYIGKHDNRFDSYIQRVNPDGTLPWGENGLDFDINQTNFEMDTRIAVEEGSTDLWAVCTYTNTSQSERGEYVQKINTLNGTRLFTDNAKEVYAIGTENTHAGELFVYNDEAFFLLEKGYNDGVSAVMLDVVLLDNSGDFAWTEESKPIASNAGTNKGGAHLNKRSNEQSVIVFRENKNSSANGAKIYVQNFSETETGISNKQIVNEDRYTYTNPVRESLRINGNETINSIAIVDITGRQVFNKVNLNTNTFNLNTTGWNKGIYILTINSKESHKIIRE